MNKFNPEAIVCTDFSIDVVLFSGDLTPEECSKVFEKAVHEDYPIPMLNDVIILGTEEYMKGAKYSDPIVRENGLVAPPTHIDDDIEF
mgnify:CR=1 FL=1